MRKVISSPFTFIFKFIFPGGWVAMGLSDLARGPSGAEGLFVCLWLGLGLLFFRRVMFPLKKVSVGDGSLRVSNFWREVEVPLSEIEHVEAVGLGCIGWTLPSVIVELKAASAFGRRIRFIPRQLNENVVAELRRAAEQSRPSLTGGRT